MSQRVAEWMCLVLLTIAVPAHADLHYVTRVSARHLTPAEPENAVSRQAAELLIKIVLPEGSAETTYWVGDKVMRVELSNRMGNKAAGTIMLRQADGTVLVLNPRERTYWRIQAPRQPPVGASAPSRGARPDIPVAHTGSFETIAGVRAEQVTIRLSSAAARRSGAAGAQQTAIDVDSWVSDQFSKYAALAAQNDALLTLVGAPSLTERRVRDAVARSRLQVWQLRARISGDTTQRRAAAGGYV